MCQHLSKERTVEKRKSNGAAETWVSAPALRYSFCLSLRKPSLWWLIFIPRKGKILLLISSRVLRVPISFLRNAHFFSSSRNFPLPDSPHQIRWSRLFSFGKRLECCFILLAHFSAQSEKKSNISQSYEDVSYCIGIWRRGRETLQMLTWSPKETNSNWWKGCITKLQKGKISVFLSLFTMIRVRTIEFSIGTTILYIWKKSLNYLNSIDFL